MPGEAELPQGPLRKLAFRNAAEVRSGKDFHDHVDRLIRDLVQLVLRAASTHEPSPARLAVLEHEREITDPLRYAVNLRTGRLVAKRAARPPAGADGAPRRRRRSSVT